MDNVQYTLIPVDGKSHLENAFRTHSDQVFQFMIHIVDLHVLELVHHI